MGRQGAHSFPQFSRVEFFLFSKLKRPLGKRESPVGNEVRPTQASTHHCSQTPWAPGLLLSLGYPVGLVPSYGAGAWKEVTATVKSHYNKVRKEQGKYTHCNRDRIHRGSIPVYLNSCTGKANKTTLEVLFSRCYFQSGIYGPLKIWRERARGNAAPARCYDTRDKGCSHPHACCPSFFPRVTQDKFQHWRHFYLQVVASDKLFYYKEFHVLTLVSLHLHDIPSQ